MSERGVTDQPLAARTAAAQSHHAGICPAFVYEHQAVPDQTYLAFASNVGARERPPRAFAPQRTKFFLKLMSRRSKNRQTALRLPGIPRFRIAATTSSSVKSGCPVIRPSRNPA